MRGMFRRYLDDLGNHGIPQFDPSPISLFFFGPQTSLWFSRGPGAMDTDEMLQPRSPNKVCNFEPRHPFGVGVEGTPQFSRSPIFQTQMDVSHTCP